MAAKCGEAGAFPVLHLGRDRKVAEKSLADLCTKTDAAFGVSLVDAAMADIDLPAQVTHVLLPWGMKPPKRAGLSLCWQVHSRDEAEAALKKNVTMIVLKGSEGGGQCGTDSSFLLFQALHARCAKAGVALYIQGGVGVHTSAAYIALGATGVVFDSQVALLREASIPESWQTAFGKLNGSEVHGVEGYRYLPRPGVKDPVEGKALKDVLKAVADGDAIPVGQDIVLAQDYADDFRKVKHFVRAVRRAIYALPLLAKTRDTLAPGSSMAKELGTDFPIVQGPMARVSDVPTFLCDVANGGALPFYAISMQTGEAARQALAETAAAMDGKPWGVGILGFIYPNVFEEQTKLILEAKPPFVLIAGGRPSQAKAFEQAGIKVYLHVPASGLLDMYLKEGARSFIFEGRESGGHVGPLRSTVLWEKQMLRLLRHEAVSSMKVLFAGGIHDELSAAFVGVMAAPLTARDAKVGVQLGTAYLYTDEIVKSGAITEDYRRMLIEGNRTVLLKSGIGQETRAVPSPYTDFFASEKARLLAEGTPSAEILMKLEDLNLGRTRIASKGIVRKGDNLEKLTKQEQLQDGLFMTGALTAIIDRKTTIKKIHAAVSEGGRRRIEAIAETEPPAPVERRGVPADIAIIGMACVFPGAENLDAYWSNIIFGRDEVREVPPERWSADLFYNPDTRDTDFVSSKWGAFLEAVDFDPMEFGITPQSLAAIEPVQLLSLLVTKRALEDAGFTDLNSADLEDTSVIFGTQGQGDLMVDYMLRPNLMRLTGKVPEDVGDYFPRLTEDSFPGVLSNVVAGRITNRLNMTGRNYTVDAACASSLAALDVAFDELATCKADMVVLGGADTHNGIGDFLMFSSTYALSRTGHSATFDDSADGIALGEGVGALILKRLEDAERDGNKIYAVIKGIGGSSDGKVLGLTAPSRQGQIKALERAYDRAGILPSEVGLVEAHGTGTVVGDRTELGALNDVFLDAGARAGHTRLGSVKTQIGHTKCAAGVAGVIKVALAVQHGVFPPTLHLRQPNSAFAQNGPFSFFAEKAGLWDEDRRVAGVSGFGFGGTNFHTIIENYRPERPDVSVKAWPSELFVFRGEQHSDAVALMGKVKELYALNNRIAIKDVAYSLATYSDKPVQVAIVAKGRDELLARIEAAVSGTNGDGVYRLAPVEGKVAFLFPGQGSQRVNMANDLFVLFPQMRSLLTEHPEYAGILFPESVFTPEGKKAQNERITDTRNAQPLLGIVDLAVARLLASFGVQADMVAGHSYGELPALCFAGAFDEGDLPALSRQRAESILAAAGDDPGRMAAVRTDRETLDGMLKDEKEVWAVNFNAPTQTVVGGTSDGIAAFLQKLDENKVPYSELNVACAFHTPLLAAAKGLFAKPLKDVKFGKPRLAVWSNTTAEPYPLTAASIRGRLAEHVVNPVRFTDEAEAMYEDGARVFIEAGPGATMTGLVSKTLKGKEIVTITTERSGEEGLTHLLNGLAAYVSTGREINMEALFEGRDAQALDLDQPENHKKSPMVWNVNGARSVPENGNLPAHAGKPIMNPILAENFGGRATTVSGVDAESLVMAYLDNMNAMIQDQRDVMLGYLGTADIVPRAAAPARRTAIAADAHALQADTGEGTEVVTLEAVPLDDGEG
ncbi:MAG: acyltransferase domain-containing protein, partial [Clostridiales Family XIII bacterium]|nr:acyltransferase domain-containing protein [Clostridiales Family XIII bacterium]